LTLVAKCKILLSRRYFCTEDAGGFETGVSVTAHRDTLDGVFDPVFGTVSDSVFDSVRRGLVPAHIYNDKELFALEKGGCSAGRGRS
jgi:hypothetical protein